MTGEILRLMRARNMKKMVVEKWAVGLNATRFIPDKPRNDEYWYAFNLLEFGHIRLDMIKEVAYIHAIFFDPTDGSVCIGITLR